MAVPQTTTYYSMGYASALNVQSQNRVRTADYHTAGNQTNSFTDPLDYLNSTLWSRSDGWANGAPFDCGWQADHVSFVGGKMVLTLDNTPSSGKPYTSGEYRSQDFYGYGTYEASIKASSADGVVGGSFFIYTGPSDGNQWDEIDIEFVKGKMQVNYVTNGVGSHETLIDLGFDPSLSFHTYKIDWQPGRITWYVDGVAVHSEDGSRGPLPTTPGRIMANLWPGDSSVDGWLGHFNYTSPITVQYDWIKFTPASTSTPTPTPTPEDKDRAVAYPNPCTGGRVNIRYAMAGNPSDVKLYIYTISGELVATLDSSSGLNEFTWDCRNRQGSRVARGLYIYQVRAGGKKPITGKIAIIN